MYIIVHIKSDYSCYKCAIQFFLEPGMTSFTDDQYKLYKENKNICVTVCAITKFKGKSTHGKI